MKTLFILILVSMSAAALTAQTKSPNGEASEKATIAAQNKFIAEQNVAFAQGNKLFQEKAYASAYEIYSDIIKKYLGVIPNHPQLASIVTNASMAMRLSMAEIYNEALRVAPKTTTAPAVVKARDLALETTRAGFINSAELAKTAVKMAFDADINPKYASATTKAQYLAALANRVEAVSTMAQYVERAVSDETHQIFLQYLSVEKDANKKRSAWLKLAKLYVDTGSDLEKASAIYDAILKDSPNNLDALFHGGTCLVVLSVRPGMVTGAGYLKRFLTLAPANDARRKDAQETLDYLKTTEGIAP